MNTFLSILTTALPVIVNVVFWLTLINILLDFGLAYYTADAAETTESTRSLRRVIVWYEAVLIGFAVLVAWKCLWDRPDYISEGAGSFMAIVALVAITNTTNLYKHIEHHLARHDAVRRGFVPHPLENGEL